MDNSKKQEIVSFEKVVAGEPSPSSKPRVHNIVLLDVLNSTFSDLPENRMAMLKILSELAKVENLTFLMLGRGLRIVSDPTSPEGGFLGKLAKQGFNPATADLAAYDWVFSDQLGLMQLFTPAGVLDRVRIQNTMGALQTIAGNYQGRSGRKNLYWITRGVPLTMGEAGAGYNEQKLNQGGSGNIKNNSAADDLKTADGLSMFAKDMEHTGRVLNNANVAVYVVDARSMAVDNMRISDQASMNDVAKATGGVAFTSPKDLGVAMRDAIDDSRIAYVLRYAISELKTDGKLHQIKVDSSRKDAKLRYREGYYAPAAGK